MWWWEEIPVREMGVARRELPSYLTTTPAVAGKEAGGAGTVRSLPARIQPKRPGVVDLPARDSVDARDYVAATTDRGQPLFRDFRDLNRALGAGGRLVRGPAGGIIALISGFINVVLGPPADPTVTDDPTDFYADPTSTEAIDQTGADAGMLTGSDPVDLDQGNVRIPRPVDDSEQAGFPVDDFIANVQDTIGPSLNENVALTGTPRGGDITENAQLAGPQPLADSQMPEKVALPDPVADPFNGGGI